MAQNRYSPVPKQSARKRGQNSNVTHLKSLRQAAQDDDHQGPAAISTNVRRCRGGSSREIPQTPWPDVQPSAIRVPQTTNSPARQRSQGFRSVVVAWSRGPTRPRLPREYQSGAAKADASAQVLRPDPSDQAAPTMPLAPLMSAVGPADTPRHTIQSTVPIRPQIQSASIICYFRLKDRHKCRCQRNI